MRLHSLHYNMVLGAEVQEEILASHKHIVGKDSVFLAFSVTVEFFFDTTPKLDQW